VTAKFLCETKQTLTPLTLHYFCLIQQM